MSFRKASGLLVLGANGWAFCTPGGGAVAEGTGAGPYFLVAAPWAAGAGEYLAAAAGA